MPPHRVRFYGRRAEGAVTPLVVHFHGGAFVSGSVDHPSVVAQLLAEAGAVVLSVDYPLAPDHPFPSAVEAAYATVHWAHAHRQQLAGKGSALFVAGEEAGGCIAAAVALMARDRHGPPVDGQILWSPLLDASMGTASMRCAQGTPAGAQWAGGWREYLSCPCDASHPYATPMAGTRLSGLPPLLLLSSPADPLRDEGRRYAGRLSAAGVPVVRELMDPSIVWARHGHAQAARPDAGGAGSDASAAHSGAGAAGQTAHRPPALPGGRANSPSDAAAAMEAVRARLFSFFVTHPAGAHRRDRSG
jgi:acetyl esterase/lipase